eukprot:gene21080-15580_t
MRDLLRSKMRLECAMPWDVGGENPRATGGGGRDDSQEAHGHDDDDGHADFELLRIKHV